MHSSPSEDRPVIHRHRSSGIARLFAADAATAAAVPQVQLLALGRGGVPGGADHVAALGGGADVPGSVEAVAAPLAGEHGHAAGGQGDACSSSSSMTSRGAGVRPWVQQAHGGRAARNKGDTATQQLTAVAPGPPASTVLLEAVPGCRGQTTARACWVLLQPCHAVQLRTSMRGRPTHSMLHPRAQRTPRHPGTCCQSAGAAVEEHGWGKGPGWESGAMAPELTALPAMCEKPGAGEGMHPCLLSCACLTQPPRDASKHLP